MAATHKSIHMKKLLLLVLIFCSSTIVFAQPQDAKQLHTTAKTFMRDGDYDNALLVLNKALQQEPSNIEMLLDLEFLYYLKKDYAKAMEVGKPLIERADADVMAYQMLGMTYKAIAEYKECTKLYKKALTRFPNSGVVYSEYGELLAMDKKDDEAIEQWEKGIESDPSYSSNYYNAIKYYSQQEKPDIFWILIYGETFVNLESYTTRTAEVKKVLLEGYKRLYSLPSLDAAIVNIKKPNAFEKEVLATLAKSNIIASDGISAESLMAIRTRFVLDWFPAANEKYPFRLFEHFQHMLKEGIFDAYNQWIFGAAASPAAYDLWIQAHDKEAEGFKKFQQSRVFKLPAGQYYR